MNYISYENLYERLTNIPETQIMLILNREENIFLKKKATELMFKSYHVLTNPCTNYHEWLFKITFFQYVSDFLEYLHLLEN